MLNSITSSLLNSCLHCNKLVVATFLLVLLPVTASGQNSGSKQQKMADPGFYLVDSLILSNLTDSDRKLADSCLKVFHNSKEDTTRINALEFLIDGMVNEAWTQFQFYQLNLIESVLRKKKSGEEQLKIKKAHGTAINNIGFIYSKQGKVEKSLDAYFRSLKIREEIDHKEGIAVCYLNIGSIYDEQAEYDLSLEYYHKSYEIYEELDDKYGVVMSLNNIGTVYEEMGDLDESLNYFEQALELNEALGRKQGTAFILNNIGTIYRQRKEHQRALEYFRKSLEIREEMGFKQGLSVVLSNLGSTYLDLQNLSEAKRFFDRALKTAREIGYPNQIKVAAENFYRYYKLTGNYSKALEMHELFITMKDSLRNQETYRNTVERRAKYEYEKQKVADSIKNAQTDKISQANLAAERAKRQKNDLALSAQKKIKWYFAIGLGLTLLLSLFLFQRFRISKQQNAVIREQKRLAETQHREVQVQKNQIEQQHSELEHTHQEISDSINYAERLQKAILPSDTTLKEHLGEHFVYYHPKDVVSGDFYWSTRIEGITFVACADCTGHGVPGAMVSVVCSNALNRSVNEFALRSPGKILDKTRELVVETFSRNSNDVKDGMDISLVRIDGNQIVFSGANNPLWVIRKSEGGASSLELLEFKGDRQPIGVFDSMQPFSEHKTNLNEDDTLYLFSDGYADQFGGSEGKKFKYKALKELLLRNAQLSLSEQKQAIEDTFHHWKGDLEQLDDVCIIGVKAGLS